LKVTAKRLYSPAPPAEILKANSSYREQDWKAFLVGGINFPTPGCWEVSGHYERDELSFVVWVLKSSCWLLADVWRNIAISLKMPPGQGLSANVILLAEQGGPNRKSQKEMYQPFWIARLVGIGGLGVTAFFWIIVIRSLL